MHMAVVTNGRMITLGILAKDIFAKTVLPMDKDGESFDVLQEIKHDTLAKVKELPVKGELPRESKTGQSNHLKR